MSGFDAEIFGSDYNAGLNYNSRLNTGVTPMKPMSDLTYFKR